MKTVLVLRAIDGLSPILADECRLDLLCGRLHEE